VLTNRQTDRHMVVKQYPARSGSGRRN